MSIPLHKLNAEQRIVGGWAVLCTDDEGRHIIDQQGDLLRIDTLERAVNKAFIESSGQGKGGMMHEAYGKATVMQNLVTSPDELRLFGFDVASGPSGWLVKMKIHDDELWDEIKSGRLTELSIAGTAKRIPIDAD